MVQVLQDMHERSGWSRRRLARALGISRSSLWRWTDRLRYGQPAVRQSGPAKAKLENSAELDAAIAGLHHGAHRSRGAPALWRQWQVFISRHAFDERLRAARLHRLRLQRERLWRIVWRQPGAVWAMDPAQYGGVYWNLVGDLASRFRFELLVADELPARRIAEHLAELFERYGAPLVLKRDNGSNLVHPSVDELLDAFGVLALTSPRQYPRYNGAIEYAQREIKTAVTVLTSSGTELSTALKIAPALLNARSRPCLGGTTAAQTFQEARHAFQRVFTVDRRKEVKDWIQDRCLATVERMQAVSRHAHDAARRQAIENWLLDNRLIDVVQPKTVSPLFS